MEKQQASPELAKFFERLLALKARLKAQAEKLQSDNLFAIVDEFETIMKEDNTL